MLKAIRLPPSAPLGAGLGAEEIGAAFALEIEGVVYAPTHDQSGSAQRLSSQPAQTGDHRFTPPDTALLVKSKNLRDPPLPISFPARDTTPKQGGFISAGATTTPPSAAGPPAIPKATPTGSTSMRMFIIIRLLTLMSMVSLTGTGIQLLRKLPCMILKPNIRE